EGRRAGSGPSGGRSGAGGAESLAGGLGGRPELKRPLEGGARVSLLAELHVAPPHAHEGLVRGRSRQVGSDEHRERLPVTPHVVEGPGDLVSERRRLRGVGPDQSPRPTKRLLEQRESRIVLPQREERRPHAIAGIDVVRIAIERWPKCHARQMVAGESGPTPPEPVVETLPRRLTANRALERDNRFPEFAGEVL